MSMTNPTPPLLPAPNPPASPGHPPASRRRTVAGIAARISAGALALAILVSPGPHPGSAPAAYPSGTLEAAEPIALLPPPEPRPVHVGSAERLHRLFERIGYELEAVADGSLPVPPVVLAALPADLADQAPVERRKALFIRAVLPIVMRANEAVLAERTVLTALRAALDDGGLSPEQRHRFRRTAQRYGLPEIAPDADGFRRLLRRVDAVPVSLAVAQAIGESGWGTSRFAREGNALFGQWTWDEAAGIVPASRPAGENHRVRRFRSLTDSAAAYLHNLNTHPAYAGFREARAGGRREHGGLPAGEALAQHLERYSERGADYVDDLVALIRQNRLARLDAAELGRTTRFAEIFPIRATMADG